MLIEKTIVEADKMLPGNRSLIAKGMNLSKGKVDSTLDFYKIHKYVRQTNYQTPKGCRKLTSDKLNMLKEWIKDNAKNKVTLKEIKEKALNLGVSKKSISIAGIRRILGKNLNFSFKNV